MKARKKKEESESEMEIEDKVAENMEEEQINHPILELMVINFSIIYLI